jgi:hypothetical protein
MIINSQKKITPHGRSWAFTKLVKLLKILQHPASKNTAVQIAFVKKSHSVRKVILLYHDARNKARKTSVPDSGYRCFWQSASNYNIKFSYKTAIDVKLQLVVAGDMGQTGNIQFTNLGISAHPDVFPDQGLFQYHFRKHIVIGIPENKQNLGIATG